MTPSVFVAVLYDEAVRLCRCLESAVVVGVASAAILYALLVVEVMHHFVKQRRRDFFNRPRKRPRAYVNLMCSAELGNPCVLPQGKMTVGARRGLYRNGRS